MYSVRTSSDKAILHKLYQQATKRALSSGKEYRKHAIIAEALRSEINNMLIFEEWRICADGSVRRER